MTPPWATSWRPQLSTAARKAMPVEYNNVNTPYYSEVDRTWSTPQNWTTNGATDFSLWFRGSPAAFLETASGITLSGSGADIYQGTDEFRFAYKKLSGDGSITVRVDSVQTLTDWTKSGVMIRDSLEPLAMQVHMISAARQSLVEWMYRSIMASTTTTALATAANSNPLPVWLRITRAGNVFTGEYSANGTSLDEDHGDGWHGVLNYTRHARQRLPRHGGLQQLGRQSGDG